MSQHQGRSCPVQLPVNDFPISLISPNLNLKILVIIDETIFVNAAYLYSGLRHLDGELVRILHVAV